VITISEILSLLILQADPDTDEVYAQMTLQPVNTVSIKKLAAFAKFLCMVQYPNPCLALCLLVCKRGIAAVGACTKAS
jgi:hypothetical protein